MRISGRHRDRPQPIFANEHILPQIRDALGNGHIGHAAECERYRADDFDAIGYRQVGDASIVERCFSNVRDTGRNRHAAQADILKCIAPDAGDGQAVGRAGNGHIAARSGVPGDGDGISIGRVGELGLDARRSREQQG